MTKKDAEQYPMLKRRELNTAPIGLYRVRAMGAKNQPQMRKEGTLKLMLLARVKEIVGIPQGVKIEPGMSIGRMAAIEGIESAVIRDDRKLLVLQWTPLE